MRCLGGSVIATCSALERLTARELEVHVLMVHGLTNSDISRYLVVTESTVKTHASRTLTKLGLLERAQAAVTPYRSGLVAADDPLPPGAG